MPPPQGLRKGLALRFEVYLLGFGGKSIINVMVQGDFS